MDKLLSAAVYAFTGAVSIGLLLMSGVTPLAIGLAVFIYGFVPYVLGEVLSLIAPALVVVYATLFVALLCLGLASSWYSQQIVFEMVVAVHVWFALLFGLRHLFDTYVRARLITGLMPSVTSLESAKPSEMT